MLRRQRQIRIVADDERVLAAKLEADLREHGPSADGPLNQLAGRHRAREADEADARIFDERRADFRAHALHDRVDAARQPRFPEQPAERDSGLRRQLVRLRDHRVAADERGKRLPRNAGERAVERHDGRADADRRSFGPHRAVRNRARHRPAVETAAFALHEHAEIGRRSDFGDGALPRLAGFRLHNRREIALVRAQQRRGAPEDLAALRGGQPRPAVGGGSRGVDRAGRVRGRAACHGRDHAVVNRRALLERLPADGRDLAVVDPVKNGVGVQREREPLAWRVRYADTFSPVVSLSNHEQTARPSTGSGRAGGNR